MMIVGPRDDAGMQGRNANNADRAAAAISPLTATHAVGTQPTHIAGVAVAAPSPYERRRGERRLDEERRQQRRSVMLDTRAHAERRTRERRRDSISAQTHRMPRGVNIFA